MPTLIKRIIKEAALPPTEEEMLYKFNRHQLLELYVYITELKKTNEELIKKIQKMNQSSGGGDVRTSES